ncbi:unnamed protein product [Lymnaea stagnalis]|uniref:phosphatidylinositol-3,5-bisphosphate 3-phosphatase n=1 Tax=Lymnaea stagnalis TaxID=6523 RepID=A0AAV2HPU7_LYMST
MDINDCQQVPQFEKSNPLAQVPPLPLLLGEYPVLVSQTADGNAMITNFRFCVCERHSFINIPLMMVSDLLVIEAAKRLRVGCKDGATYSCTFATAEDCNQCTSLLRERTGQPTTAKKLFAYTFYRLVQQKEKSTGQLSVSEVQQISLCQPGDDKFSYTFGKEVTRLGFDTSRKKIWRMSSANERYEFCATYPKDHILPATYEDDKLKSSLDFRAMKRFPSVVWRDKSSGVVLIRSSQPLSSFLGLSYFHNPADVALLEDIVQACNKDYLAAEEQTRVGKALLEQGETLSAIQSRGMGGNCQTNSCNEEVSLSSMLNDTVNWEIENDPEVDDDTRTARKLAIVDCRSLAGVWGNSFKGGGTEDEVVYKCNIIHLDLANIHTVRDSFNKLRTLCHSYVEGTYYKNLSGSMWLTYISALLRGANMVVELMHVKKRPVLVHCSDGWDRTSQIVSLSEVMMDPYYRTFEGFQVVVEREWLHFGHKFAERGGHDPNCSDTNQISPVFLQFLDCVYQLTLQYPAEFQFNEAYLVKLLKHSQACLFGNFLYNCQKERENWGKNTASVWSLLRPENIQFVNLLYDKTSQQVLTAKFSEHDVVLWKSVYMAGLSPWPHGSQIDFYLDSSPAGGSEDGANLPVDGVPRSKSMDDLSKASMDSGRRNSDPSITQSQESASSVVTHGQHNTSSSHEMIHCAEELASSSAPKLLGVCTGEDSVELQEIQPSTANISLEDNTEQVVHLTPHDIISKDRPAAPAAVLNGNHSYTFCETDVHGTSINGENIAELNGSSLGLISSVVFCPETMGKCEHALCCDSPKSGVTLCCNISTFEPNVLSRNYIPNGVCKGHDCRAVRSQSLSSNNKFYIGDGVPPQTAASVSNLSDYNQRQMSLLAERLAESNWKHNDTDIHYLYNSNFRNHSNCDEDQHSMDKHDKEHSSTSAANQLINGTKHLTYINGKSGQPESGASRLERNQFIGIHSPNQADNTRTSINSASTDTLTDDIESGKGDSVLSVEPYFLEVGTTPDNRATSSLSSLLCPLKRESLTALTDVSGGNNLMSRRARAASGASRDLSASPSGCRGNWNDTGRLRHPSGGDLVTRSWLGATVATSTTDISDSCVGKLTSPCMDRQPSIKQHIDVDGLTLFCDERQRLLTECFLEKDRLFFEMENRYLHALDQIKGIRHQQLPNNYMDEYLMSESEGGDNSSLCSLGNPASDASWENVDESESKIVMWVPDTAVTHCAGCGEQFWVLRPKHHCRKCGRIFCFSCSNYQSPVPDQQLHKPVRVCRRCHSELVQQSPGASSDGRIPTLVTDG